ncbi:PIN domain-containing protein [Patescibacteria group bacterium]
MIYFIDTNIFLRVLVKEDKVSFQESKLFLRKVKEGKVRAVTGSLILAEVAWTLASYYQFSKKDVVESLEGIINLPKLKVIDSYRHQLALKLFKEMKVKYIDSLVASANGFQKGEWWIISYDRDFNKLGVKRVEPGKIRG